MGVFAKLGDFKSAPPGSAQFAMDYETIKWIFKDPKKQASLQQAGFSRNGISELMEAKSLTNEKDRKLVAMIIASALG